MGGKEGLRFREAGKGAISSEMGEKERRKPDPESKKVWMSPTSKMMWMTMVPGRRVGNRGGPRNGFRESQLGNGPNELVWELM